VGGTISTNFIDPVTTLGSATGDLRGGVGVTVKSVSPPMAAGTVVFTNHHQWVTETGDTLFFNDADATAFPTPPPPTGVPGLYAVSYMNGITLSGGTGRFAGATGSLTAFGAVDQTHGQIVLRYQGQICFQPNPGRAQGPQAFFPGIRGKRPVARIAAVR
jgi:hypothetical protein